MARTVSAVFKFQGTIEDITHVNSKAYGPHVRAKKNSKTPFVMTAALAESRDRLQLCNQYLRPVFQALRREGCDGRFWSRLVSRQFAELRAGRSMNLECLRGFDCNLQHPLGDVIKGSYDFSATVVHNQLQVRVRLDQHPVVNDELPRTGYQLKVVAIFRDAVGTVHKEVGLGPLTKYGSALDAVELRIPVPDGRFVGKSDCGDTALVCGDTNQGGGGECMLLLGVVPHLQAQGATKVMSDSGMKVMWVGDVPGFKLQVTGREGASGCQLPVSGGEVEGFSPCPTPAGLQYTALAPQQEDCSEVDKLIGLRVDKKKAARDKAPIAAFAPPEESCREKPVVGYQLSSSGYGVPIASYGGGWYYTYSSTVMGGGLFVDGGWSEG